VTASGPDITNADLPADVRGSVRAEAALTPEERADRERLTATLAQTGWNRTKAAASLGVSRVTLWKRMRRYGLLSEVQAETPVKASSEHRSP
jgi:transcriptional regulator of acetoin/glycerol metabolism